METIAAPLQGKVAIVTAGSRGIGASIVESLAVNGCSHIAFTYNSNTKAAKDLTAKISEVDKRIKIHNFAMDVCHPEAGKFAVEEALRGLDVNHIDIVVNNAAVIDAAAYPNAADMTKECFDKAMTGNAWTPFLLAREAAKVMPRGGRVINISSAGSKFPTGDPHVLYNTSKAALDTVSRNLAVVYGTSGITVNAISVGPTDTDSFRGVEKKPDRFEAMLKSMTMEKRNGQVQEVAAIVVFIASSYSRLINGNIVPANGGMLAAAQ